MSKTIGKKRIHLAEVKILLSGFERSIEIGFI